jgi:vacuolar-type H+-ATPase subunit H
MSIHDAIDRIEYLIAHSRQIPLTRTVVVDQEEALGLIDDLRLSLPDEIKQARWTLQEQQRLLSEAQSEAARIINQASERAQTMIGQQELARRAEKQAEGMLRETSARADEIRRAADRYAWEVMQQLESQLLKTVATVKKGVEALRKPAPPTVAEPATRR